MTLDDALSELREDVRPSFAAVVIVLLDTRQRLEELDSVVRTEEEPVHRNYSLEQRHQRFVERLRAEEREG